MFTTNLKIYNTYSRNGPGHINIRALTISGDQLIHRNDIQRIAQSISDDLDVFGATGKMHVSMQYGSGWKTGPPANFGEPVILPQPYGEEYEDRKLFLLTFFPREWEDDTDNFLRESDRIELFNQDAVDEFEEPDGQPFTGSFDFEPEEEEYSWSEWEEETEEFPEDDPETENHVIFGPELPTPGEPAFWDWVGDVDLSDFEFPEYIGDSENEWNSKFESTSIILTGEL